MRVVRLLIAGLIALGAMLAVFFAAVVVCLTGLAAYVVQWIRGGPAPVRPPPPGARSGRFPAAGVIEVTATKVSSAADEP